MSEVKLQPTPKHWRWVVVCREREGARTALGHFGHELGLEDEGLGGVAVGLGDGDLAAGRGEGGGEQAVGEDDVRRHRRLEKGNQGHEAQENSADVQQLHDVRSGARRRKECGGSLVCGLPIRFAVISRSCGQMIVCLMKRVACRACGFVPDSCASTQIM